LVPTGAGGTGVLEIDTICSDIMREKQETERETEAEQREKLSGD
jgi:hypothetical protein